MMPNAGPKVASKVAKQRATAAFAIGLVLALTVLGGNEYAYWRAKNAFDTMRGLDRASASVQQILHRLVDAESAQRGYLLTTRKDYLLPGVDARSDIQSALSDLRAHFGTEPELRPYIDALSDRTDARLAELQETLTLHEHDRTASARELLLTNIGWEKMQEVRQSARDLLSIAHRQADAERARVDTTLDVGRIGIHASMTLSLLGFLYYLRKSAALQFEQRLHANDLQRERQRLEAEVTVRTQELRGLNERLQLVREDERGRIARTLHDELGSILTAAKLDLARLRRLVDSHESAEAQVRLDHLALTLDQGINLKRGIMEELMPSALHNFGLREALKILADEFSTSAHLPIDLALDEVATSSRSRVLAYRWVESALADVTQHAHATCVRIGLKAMEGDLLQVAIHDDGDAAASAMDQSQDDAVVNLRHRIEGLGGSVVVGFVPGYGNGRVATMPARSHSDTERDPTVKQT